MAVANTKVLISGAGIAGPTLAYWLKTYGFDPTVVEQAPKPREGGYWFHLHGANGIAVLKRMGVWPAVMEARRVDKQSVYVGASGVPFARLDTGQVAADVEPTRMQITILRSDLARIVYEHTKDCVDYIFGDSIAALEKDADGVAVTFASGRTRRFHLVVGADGLHSRVRALTFGGEARFEKYLGHYIAAFTPQDFPVDYGVDIVYTVPGKTAVVSGMNANRTVANFLFKQPVELGDGAHDTERQRQLVFEAFAGEGWQIPRLLAAMQTAPDFFCDAVSQVRMERWSNGRICLVGDAAFCPTPLSGYGSQLALAGAYILAGELSAAGRDHRAAFAAYERALRPLVEEKQKNPERAVTQFVPESAFRLWVRDRVLRLISLPLVSPLVLKITYGRLLREPSIIKGYPRPGA